MNGAYRSHLSVAAKVGWWLFFSVFSVHHWKLNVAGSVGWWLLLLHPVLLGLSDLLSTESDAEMYAQLEMRM